jgi:hypothetical protein
LPNIGVVYDDTLDDLNQLSSEMSEIRSKCFYSHLSDSTLYVFIAIEEVNAHVRIQQILQRESHNDSLLNIVAPLFDEVRAA